jgi:NADH dehydrogenase
VGEAEPGVPAVKQTDEWEPTEVASAGEAVISEAKAREAAEQHAPEPAKNQPGGEPAKRQPGPEPAKNQPGPEPAKSQPTPEPAKKQPGGEPDKVPGPVKRTDADPAEGDS